MKHTIAMTVNDEPGVMAKISGMFARRGFNIDTITVGKTQKEGISKIVITVIGDDKVIEQVEKQLNKMIDVIKVIELPAETSVIRELCLVKISAPDQKKHDEIVKYANGYNCRNCCRASKNRHFPRAGKAIWHQGYFKNGRYRHKQGCSKCLIN